MDPSLKGTKGHGAENRLTSGKGQSCPPMHCGLEKKEKSFTEGNKKERIDSVPKRENPEKKYLLRRARLTLGEKVRTHLPKGVTYSSFLLRTA